jgi:hypothetical protein
LVEFFEKTPLEAGSHVFSRESNNLLPIIVDREGNPGPAFCHFDAERRIR